MGWLFFPKPDNIKEHFRQLMTTPNTRPLDLAIVHRLTLYAAVENTVTGDVFAMVYLLRYQPGAEDGCDFGYKDIEESMGPVEADCPERILKLLTPTEYPYAQEWRERCWANIERRKLLRKGNRIRFEDPIRFTDGARLSLFEVVSPPSRFRSLENGGLYRISRAHTRKAELIND